MLDAFEALYPDCQLLLEVDHSSGHTKATANGLSIHNMNLKYGGKKPALRPSVMTENTINMNAAENLLPFPFDVHTNKFYMNKYYKQASQSRRYTIFRLPR